jgi:hypothetical protein
MKKLGYLFGFFCFFSLLYGCGKPPKFDANLLTGKWQQGTLFERYFADGNGYTWDEGDDVNEEEAQKFTWTLDKDNLIQYHLLESSNAIVPRPCTVTELTENSLKYNDGSTNYHFQKVEN